MNYKTIPVKTPYIRSNEGYDKLVTQIVKQCKNGDYIVISETPISTAEGNLVDESKYKPGIISTFLCDIWSKRLFGYIISPLIHDKKRTIDNLRKMPKEARYHKEFILREYGLRYGLMPTSEAGVDLSNVPDQYVSLLPENPEKSAVGIRDQIKNNYNMDVEIIIIDTDATYQIHNTKFTMLPKSIKSIKNGLGIYGYLLKTISKKLGPTILASTVDKSCDELIHIASICEEMQLKYSEYFFDTIYSMKEKYNTDITKISADMLEKNTHIPAIIFRIE